MTLNKNIVLVLVAVAMTFAMWMMPETISAQSNKQRLLLTTYNTNPTRTDSVNKFCVGVSSRAELICTSQKQTAQSYKASLADQLKIQGNDFINKVINGGDYVADAQASTTPLGLFIGFFAVGFVIIMIQWMCLCCCCCCPGCCPSKCCQKDENQQYSKCQLYWPSIFLILLLLLIITVSAIGLSKASTFKKGISDLQCSTSMLFDDIVNGNVTADGSSFFTGISTMVTSVTSLSSNMANIQGNITDLKNNLTTIVSGLTAAKTDIQKVPNNVAAGGNAVITYNTKISDTFGTTTGTTDSLFVSVLGSSSTGGIIGTFYTAMDATYTTLSGIESSSADFVSGASGFSTSVGSLTSDLNNLKTQMTDLDSGLKSSLELMDTPKEMGTLVINLIYGIALGLAVLALLGVVLMTFCDKYKCRYLMYFSCVLLFFLGVLGFLIAIIFSIIVPVMFFLCEWLDTTIGTSTGFDTNVQKFISDASIRGYITPCLSGGSGDLMAAVGGASIGTTINGLKDAIQNTNTFNTTSQVNAIDTSITNITSVIDSVKNGETPDVSDTDSLLALKIVADPANLTGTCAAATVDSWILSTTNTSLCTVSSGASISPSGTCSQVQFEANNAACQGCIDTSLVLNTWYPALSTAGDWKTKLDAKYTAACSAPWRTYFGNVWDNYYKVKVPQMAAISSRWGTVTTTLTTVKADITNVNTTMTNVIFNLVTSFDTITDPTYGLIAGLNCKIIGEDLTIIVSAICVSNFNTIYITRLLMGISAFGILFAMCCIVCSGVRHFKHSERKDRISPNFMGDKNSFENTDAAFRP